VNQLQDEHNIQFDIAKRERQIAERYINGDYDDRNKSRSRTPRTLKIRKPISHVKSGKSKDRFLKDDKGYCSRFEKFSPHKNSMVSIDWNI
jgi:hypothetical protein